MNKKNSEGSTIHDKAVRLLEGGIVQVDSVFVRAVKAIGMYATCEVCEMDSLCRFGTEMLEVCKQCDFLSNNYYYLKLINSK